MQVKSLYMNKIVISGLKVRCVIGIKPEERLAAQEIMIDLELSAALSKAAQSDDIKDTVDYDDLARKLTGFVERSRFNLIEKLAYETAKIAKDISGSEEVLITVKKPSALKNADYSAVSMKL